MQSPSLDGQSTDVLAAANHPFLWACALGVFVVIIVQSVIYIRAARKAAPSVGLSGSQLFSAYRSGAVAAIGPSLAVVIVAVALLAVFGTPATLVRIGLIGSAAFETGAANIAAGAAGATLGGDDYTQSVFAVAFFSMSLGGAMWMVATLIMTPLLKRGEDRMEKVNPAVLTVVPGAALIAAFASLGIGEVPKSDAHLVTLVAAAASMALFGLVAAKAKMPWLREWGLGLSIIIALAAAYFSHTAGLGPAA
ncbi:DUF5058 family protein [Zhihengliuella salsuginis]|uniref:DUF5058 domain-containing protein n=1 Tax=Zhihengliuella salsuginis TaxID=578222 RepID=A0ABQ3GDB3_9MICC|nr:DUF5058 family protein [Zhihengliuella salsuginis]GHD02423.1 DUF5058 domain-containing protein [Zhihengliuella salsuginis]